MQTARSLHLRYAGTEAALIVPLADLDTILADFTAAHRARFGFATPDRPVVAETVAAEATLPGTVAAEAELPARDSGAPDIIDRVEIFTGGTAVEAPVLERTSLLAGDRIAGPALIREANATTVIEPGWTAEVTALEPHDPAPHRSPGRRACPPAANAPIRCCWNCSTTCS